MKLLFLGTGAADRMYAPLNDHFEDKDARRCASALVDGHVLIDCGPHVMNALAVAGVAPFAISDIVVTHLHGDHFCRETLINLAKAAGHPIRLWFREDGKPEELPGIIPCPMTLFSAYSVGGLTVTGVPGNHTASPQHLIFEKDGKKFFYALDGAWILYDAVKFIDKMAFDAVIFDATVGDYEGDLRVGEHNSIPMIRLMLPSLKTVGAITDNTKLILSHMAVILHKSHEETERLLAPEGLLPAWDGWEIEV